MHELLGLVRRCGLERECTAVGVGVPIADGPLGVVALVFHAEIAMAIDEIPDRVTPTFQRFKHLRTGGVPIACGDESFESQGTKEGHGLCVKTLLRFEKKPGCISIARRFFCEDVIEWTEPDTSGGKVILLCLPCAVVFLEFRIKHERGEGVTNPRDPEDSLRISSFAPAAGFDATTNPVFDVTVRTFPGLAYTLQTNPTLGTFTDVSSSTFTATNRVHTVQIRLAPEQDFLRLRRD